MHCRNQENFACWWETIQKFTKHHSRLLTSGINMSEYLKLWRESSSGIQFVLLPKNRINPPWHSYYMQKPFLRLFAAGLSISNLFSSSNISYKNWRCCSHAKKLCTDVAWANAITFSLLVNVACHGILTIIRSYFRFQQAFIWCHYHSIHSKCYNSSKTTFQQCISTQIDGMQLFSISQYWIHYSGEAEIA